jgi:N-terminal domain of reverse transcriptase
VRTEQTGERGQTAWSDIDWAATEAAVRRLQDRIYRAAAAGNRGQVKNLQKLLVRSLSAKRLAVRRVTQQNAGRNTPGVDGVVCRTPESRTSRVTGPSRSDASTFRSRTEEPGLWAFQRSGTEPCRCSSSWRWNPSGKRASRRTATGFDLDGARWTPSSPSTRPWPQPGRADGCSMATFPAASTISGMNPYWHGCRCSPPRSGAG